ncbi:helix-turn-helix domain-containing protein, partial [Streptomyces sp. 7N604]|uniref:helix-turn-helix domain-containing protein n=1 Tax=Streptomyces sp. 7N604 TaxID=3457415 RepID=UPI003FD4121E
MSDGGSEGIDVLSVLELLAKEAPPSQFEDLIRQARREGASPAALEELSRAQELALSVHALLGRRRQREAGLSALVDTARDLTTPYDLDALLELITRRARRLLSVDMSYISFHEPAESCSYVRTADGNATALTIGFKAPLFSGLGQKVTDSSAPFWTPDYLPDERIVHQDVLDEVVRAEGLRAMMAVPLRYGNSTFGILYIADRNIRHFTPDEVSLMSSLGDLAAVAIEKTRLLDRTHAEVVELELDTSRAKSRLTAVRRLGDTHSRLIDLVLTGSDLHTLAAEAADALEGTLMVRDADGRLLTATGELPGLDETEVTKAALDAHAGQARPALPDGTWVAPVVAGREDLGTLLLRPRTPLNDNGVRLLHLAAQAVAVLLLMQRSTAVAEDKVRDELFEDLLATPQRPPQQLAERARRLAVHLEKPHVVVVARPEGGAQGRALVWAASYARRMTGLKSTRDGCIVLLLPGSDASGAAQAVSAELSPLLGHPVTVGGAGPVSDPGPVFRAYREALRCLDALTALGGTGSTASAKELGFLGLLLSDNHDAEGFIAAAIGPVLEYDAQRYTDLTGTLRSYFESGGSPTRAAEALHVHPNTVSRRLERITELLGPDWQKPERALEVQLALRLNLAL